MSEEVKATATWNGFKVDTYTNVRTGEIKIFQTKQLIPVLLAKSTPGDGKAGWTYVGGSGTKFRNIYNDQQRAIGGTELTQDKFNQAFFTTGTKAFNNIRSTILTDDDNYMNAGIPVADRPAIKTSHYNNSIPGTVNPTTGLKVNSDGTKPTQQTQNQQQQTNDDGDDDGDNQPVLSAQAEDDRRGGPRGSGRDPRTGRPNPGKILRYPLDEPSGPFQYDYISITAHDYKPSGLGNLIRKKGEKIW